MLDIESSPRYARRSESRKMIEMRTRRARYMLAAVSAIVSLAGIAARGDGDLTVDASLTVSTELPESAHQALVREAESIWRSAGVRITWVAAGDGPGGAPALRVFVVRHAGTPVPDDGVVGELVRSGSGGAIAFASIARAEGVVRAAGGGAPHAAPDAVLHHRLGVVLGRAVAHEIGHYLLESSAHAGRGL